MVLKISGAPRYQLIADALLADIESGHYAVGDLLPSEADLRERYNVSRHTVREALRQLTDLGLLTRQPGVGTRVKTNRPISHIHKAGGIEDLYKLVQDLQLIITQKERCIADEALAEQLGCTVGQEWLHLQGCRYVNNEPIPLALTNVYIAKAYGRIMDFPRDPAVPIYALLEKFYGIRIDEVRQTVSAVCLDAQAAEVLHEQPGSAGLKVMREYYDVSGDLVEVGISLHPGSRFSYISNKRMITF